jgi:hypothetical protein
MAYQVPACCGKLSRSPHGTSVYVYTSTSMSTSLRIYIYTCVHVYTYPYITHIAREYIRTDTHTSAHKHGTCVHVSTNSLRPRMGCLRGALISPPRPIASSLTTMVCLRQHACAHQHVCACMRLFAKVVPSQVR